VLRELEDSGFIETIKFGKFTRKQEDRRASEYRLTCFHCNVTGDPSSRRFNPNIRWEPSDRPAKRDRSVGGNRTRAPSDQATVRPGQTLSATIKPSSVRLNHTHLDSSHGGRSSSGLLPPGWRRQRGRVVTPEGVAVPIVDNPLVETTKERAALAEFQGWQSKAAGADDVGLNSS
jgi:hypothetical protein